MARTDRNIYYPDDYNEVADIPKDLKDMAESIDAAIEEAVTEATYDDTALKARVTANEGDISDIKAEQTQQNTNIQSNADAITSLQGTVQAQGQSIEGLSNNKVDKVQGKGLSTEDYTTPEKTKLAGIEAEANKTIVDDELNDTSINPVENKVVYASQELQNTRITELEQDVDDLRGACLSVDGTGTDITLNNTAKGRLLKNDLSGRTEQEQLKGKNLFDGASPTTTASASSSLDNNIITISSAVTTTIPYCSWEVPVSEGDIVRLNAIIQNSNGRITKQTYDGSSWGGYNERNYIDGSSISSLEYTAVSGITKVRFNLYANNAVPSGAVSSNYKNVIVTKNNSDMTYEQYCRRNTSTKSSVMNALLKM